MDKLRKVIDTKPKEFLKQVRFLSNQQTFALEGEKYKRIINSTKSSVELEWYQRKNLYLVCNKSIDDRLFGRRLVEDLMSGYSMAAPLYNYLWDIKSSGA